MQEKIKINDYELNVNTTYGRLNISYKNKLMYNGVPFNDFYDISKIEAKKEGLIIEGLVKQVKYLNQRDKRMTMVKETRKMNWDLLDLSVFSKPVKKEEVPEEVPAVKTIPEIEEIPEIEDAPEIES